MARRKRIGLAHEWDAATGRLTGRTAQWEAASMEAGSRAFTAALPTVDGQRWKIRRWHPQGKAGRGLRFEAWNPASTLRWLFPLANRR